MSKEGTIQMAEVAQTAAEVAHEIMGAIIDNSKLSEHRKIGACITAVNALYAGILDGVVAHADEAQEQLIVGLFAQHISPSIAKLALKGMKKPD